MSIPSCVSERLDDSCFSREAPEAVTGSFRELGIQPPRLFQDFFLRYKGVFGSRKTGWELLDICEGAECIVTQTRLCRELYNFPKNVVVISGYLGNAVLCYDVTSDEVYNVDFEGGDEELIAGTLEPHWKSFEGFLLDFFCES